MTTTVTGTCEPGSGCATGKRLSSRRSSHMAAPALKQTATAAFQPNWVSMKGKSQPHLAATISTGGAANGVSTPPIETLTNSTPSVPYLSRLVTGWVKTASRSMSAASVMAAGSVMKEPSSGTKASSMK